MKYVPFRIDQPGSPRQHGRTVRLQATVGLALVLALAQTYGDTPAGCVRPVDDPNPVCGYSAGAGKCLKVAYSVTPQSCTGSAYNYVCWIYYVNGTETWYSHAGSGPADCGCATSGWVQDEDPRAGQIRQAYNNDTSCDG